MQTKRDIEYEKNHNLIGCSHCHHMPDHPIRENANQFIVNVLVFSTSVQSMEQVQSLKPKIDSLAGKGRWSFALDDTDRILRIVSNSLRPQAAIQLLNRHGFECNELTD